MLFIPDSFNADWYGWATNQSGHFLLGLVVAFITGRVWPAVALAVAFELIQWSPDLIDSLTDVAFTAVGAIFYVYALSGVIWYLIAAMVIGVALRLNNAKR